MSSVLLLAAGAGGELTAQIVTTIVTFVLVMFVLTIFAWKPVAALLDERAREVSKNFDEIDRRLADAAARQKEYEERLARIDDEARDRLNKAIDEGRRTAQEIVEKARHDAEDIAEKARAAVQLEIDKARIDMRREVVEMTLAATGRLLDASLDDSRHRALVEDFVSGLEKSQG